MLRIVLLNPLRAHETLPNMHARTRFNNVLIEYRKHICVNFRYIKM